MKKSNCFIITNEKDMEEAQKEAPDIRKAMQIADARMYESKADYYARHPERVWHGKST